MNDCLRTRIDQYESKCVSQSYKAGAKLAKWIHIQRANYKAKNHGKLTTARIRQLNSIGFVWNGLKYIHDQH